MESQVTEFDKELIIKLYKRGSSVHSIFLRINKYSELDIQDIIIKYTPFRSKQIAKIKIDRTSMTKYQKSKWIIDLYIHDYDIRRIAKITGSTQQCVHEILSYNGYIDEEYKDKKHYKKQEYQYNSEPLTIKKLEEFRDNNVHIGDRFKIQIEENNFYDIFYDDKPNKIQTIEVTVLNKYPHIVLTEKGCFQYFDLWSGSKISDNK